jgi:hypothetical protein
MSIAGHVSQRILAHYSHVRAEAKRKDLNALAGGGNTGSYDTNNGTKSTEGGIHTSQSIALASVAETHIRHVADLPPSKAGEQPPLHITKISFTAERRFSHLLALQHIGTLVYA